MDRLKYNKIKEPMKNFKAMPSLMKVILGFLIFRAVNGAWRFGQGDIAWALVPGNIYNLLAIVISGLGIVALVKRSGKWLKIYLGIELTMLVVEIALRSFAYRFLSLQQWMVMAPVMLVAYGITFLILLYLYKQKKYFNKA